MKWDERGQSLFVPGMTLRKEKEGMNMQNSVYAKEYTERALDYIEAVARLENRFQSRSQYRWRLQAMVEGDSPSPLRTGTKSGTKRDSPFSYQ